MKTLCLPNTSLRRRGRYRYMFCGSKFSKQQGVWKPRDILGRQNAIMVVGYHVFFMRLVIQEGDCRLDVQFLHTQKMLLRSNYSWGPWHHFASLFVLAGLIFTDQLGNVNILSNISSFVCLVFSSIRWIDGSTPWRECSGRLWKPIVLSRTKNRYNTMH